MKNKDIRTAMNHSKVKQWEVADQLGISEFTYSRWLRKELPDEKKKMILQAISDAKTKQENE